MERNTLMIMISSVSLEFAFSYSGSFVNLFSSTYHVIRFPALTSETQL